MHKRNKQDSNDILGEARHGVIAMSRRKIKTYGRKSQCDLCSKPLNIRSTITSRLGNGAVEYSRRKKSNGIKGLPADPCENEQTAQGLLNSRHHQNVEEHGKAYRGKQWLDVVTCF
ncbi:hypothetical protein OUZ56_028210 [Daphnia magna]|uniref:Uncharacterized protein n=1 Tax=Daphnia magna TaxID=35525 RepID=A0ABR0B365_9CRUS|nr:hypothetical protein OUZ56_028210 [Daphnia magna]